MKTGKVKPETATKYAQFDEGDAFKPCDVQRAKFEYTKEQTSIKLDNDRWKNRRWMAWIALWVTMAFTAAMMFWVPESRVDKLGEVVVWFYVTMVTVITAYIGASTFSDIKSFAMKRSRFANHDPYQSTPYDVYDQANEVVDNPDGEQ